MKTERTVSILMGILLVIAGIYCLVNPAITFTFLIWIIIACMLMSSISGIATWSARKKLGLANGWDLCYAILCLIFAVVLMCSLGMRLATMTVLLYFVMAWMIVTGIVRIVSAVNLHSIHASTGSVVGKSWGRVMFMGVIMVIAGLLGFARPLTAALTIGIVVGVNLIVSGLSQIFASEAAA